MFVNSTDAHIELASAIAKIIKTAELLKNDCYPLETKFDLCWELAFVHLKNLDLYKIPEEKENV